MDPFEEFEFKPLTEGLGFHKKAEKGSAPEIQQQPVNAQKSQSISDLIASLPPAMDFVDNEQPKPESRPQIFQPLGRKEYVSPDPVDIKNRDVGSTAFPPVQQTTRSSMNSTMAPTPTLRSPLAAPTANDITRSFPHLEKNRTSNTNAALRAPTTAKTSAATPLATNEKLRKVSASFAAAILDGMIAIGFASIFLVVLLTITQVDLNRMLASSTTDMQTYMQIGMLFLVVLNIYMISARGIFGSSLGEWAFDLQIGTRAEQRRPIYLVKIVWRMILVMATAFITLPILSKIFGRDLFAKLGAPQLYNHLARD
jgi:hypothetical protein